MSAQATQPARVDPLPSIFLRFLKFGLLAWGGPAAQIAMIKRECVDEEQWISEETFKKVLAVYQVLPGPEAHELCVYFGRLRGGKLGGFLAGLGFMLPGFVIMLGLLAGWFPLIATVALYALELLVAVLQAYVFALLTCLYLNDALHVDH